MKLDEFEGETELGWRRGEPSSEVVVRLLSRIPERTKRFVSCYSGWYRILDRLDSELNYLDPEYKVLEVKEKFGILRFHFESSKSEIVAEIMANCVRRAEYESSLTCEFCGNGFGAYFKERDESVSLRKMGWVKTLCDLCFEKRVARVEGING